MDDENLEKLAEIGVENPEIYEYKTADERESRLNTGEDLKHNRTIISGHTVYWREVDGSIRIKSLRCHAHKDMDCWCRT